MGAATAFLSPGARPSPPWWVRFSRWLNGYRVCVVGDCIELTDPEIVHCASHLRAFRAALGERRCAEATCVERCVGGETLCETHWEIEYITMCVTARPGDRWNV